MTSETSAGPERVFPPLGEVEPWEWAETEEAEPVVCIEHHATFTGLGDGPVDLTTTIPNTGPTAHLSLDLKVAHLSRM